MRKISILAAAATMLAVACTEPSSPVVNSTSPEVSYTKDAPGSGSGNFVYANASASSIGELVISFKQSGVGNNNVTYRVDANRTLTWACYNNGQNHPKAQNKTASSSPVAQEVTLQSNNGQIEASITVALPASPLFCPSGQESRLFSAVYSGITFAETAPEVNAATLNITTVNWP
jgi:hypothetical protein